MRSIWRTLDRRVLADVGLTCVAVFFIGLSYGAIAVASGFPLWVPATLSVLVLAGASEFLFVGIVAAGASPIAAALAGLLVNSRHLPYALALPPGAALAGAATAQVATPCLPPGLPVLLALAALLLLVRAPATAPAAETGTGPGNEGSTSPDQEPAAAQVRTAR